MHKYANLRNTAGQYAIHTPSFSLDGDGHNDEERDGGGVLLIRVAQVVPLWLANEDFSIFVDFRGFFLAPND